MVMDKSHQHWSGLFPDDPCLASPTQRLLDNMHVAILKTCTKTSPKATTEERDSEPEGEARRAPSQPATALIATDARVERTHAPRVGAVAAPAHAVLVPRHAAAQLLLANFFGAGAPGEGGVGGGGPDDVAEGVGVAVGAGLVVDGCDVDAANDWVEGGERVTKRRTTKRKEQDGRGRCSWSALAF